MSASKMAFIDRVQNGKQVSRFSVWITVVQETEEMEEQFGYYSSKLAEQNKEKKGDLNTK